MKYKRGKPLNYILFKGYFDTVSKTGKWESI